MSKWRDIETAPKDGTTILVAVCAFANGISYGDHQRLLARWSSFDGEWRIFPAGGKYGEFIESHTFPQIKWQPLPEAPK